MSTIPGAVDWTAATTTFVDVTGDTMTGALKTIYYFQVSSTVAGLRRIEWADGSVSTFAVTGGATSAELGVYKTLVGDTTNWIGISTGTERTERIAADNEIKLSTGTLLPLDGSKAMTGNLNMAQNNITNTSTHTVNTLNVTQINWADGQVSSTSHFGDITEAQGDIRYIKKVGGDSVFGSLKTTYYMQVSTTLAGVKRIEWNDGSVSTGALVKREYVFNDARINYNSLANNCMSTSALLQQTTGYVFGEQTAMIAKQIKILFGGTYKFYWESRVLELGSNSRSYLDRNGTLLSANTYASISSSTSTWTGYSEYHDVYKDDIITL